jgi:hypothetical protein
MPVSLLVMMYECAQVFYNFGIANVIKNKMSADPQWARLRGTARGATASGDYYGSAEAHRIDDATGTEL